MPAVREPARPRRPPLSATERLPEDKALSAAALDALELGDLQVVERLLSASNATFAVELVGDDDPVRGVYKPIRGEQPLWDFPEGTLAAREVAAYAVSEALGWDVVPPTIMRDGPYGPGMVQLWIDVAAAEPVVVVPAGQTPAGYLHVVDAYDARDRPVSLLHEDTDALRRMAIFDVLVNNTDRKGGHVLPDADGHRYGIDHGVTFHVEPKLRTVLWGWAGQPVPPELIEDIQRLTCDNDLLEQLTGLITADEVHAFVRRSQHLARRVLMPRPTDAWRAFPWPLF